jgi:sialate O-acetylesterase
MKHLALLAAALLAPLFALAEINLPALFSDGMVLQQGKKLPVWGWADAGTKVTVSFAQDSVSATTPANGKWMVRLPAQKASADGRELSVKAGNETKVIKDVLVGEVWLCGGQSNMDFTLKQLAVKTRDPKHQPLADYVTKEMDTAKDPLLRQITVPRVTSPKEQKTNFQGSWIDCKPENNPNLSGTGYFFARELRRELGVPVGLIKCPWGGTLVEPWIPPSGFTKNADMKAFYGEQHAAIDKQLADYDPGKVKAAHQTRIAKWQEDVKKAKAAKKKAPRKPRMPGNPAGNNRVPSTLFNAMIHPLIPYAVKGGIWYQGESNRRQHAREYSLYFGQMIKSWRELWGQGDFPFYFCQLAQFMDPPKEPLADDDWTEVCDQQRRTLALPNTGMAVLSDVGEAKDIHPRNKMEAGRRLSLWALAKDYGKKDLVYSGPLYKTHVVADDRILVTFESVGSGLMAGHKPVMGPTKPVDEPLKFFQIAGADKQWKWANAKLVAGDTVEVSHPEVKKPVAVRYGWAPNSEGANLYNKEGLPASLFKTDNW